MHKAQCLSQTASILENPLPAGPIDVVRIDLLQLQRSIQGSTYVLVCFDHFSRFTALAPLPNKSATTVDHAIVSNLFNRFTSPPVFLSDNGKEFKSQVLRDIYTQFHIKQTFITSHHPLSNGLVERTNRRVFEILRSLARHLQETWGIGFLTFLLLLMAPSILPQVKRLTTSCMGLRNAYLTMCFCTLLFFCISLINILNCSFTVSKLFTTLFGRNLRFRGKRCFAKAALRQPQFILVSVILS